VPVPVAGAGVVDPPAAPGALAAGGVAGSSFVAASSSQAAIPKSIIGASTSQSLLRIGATPFRYNNHGHTEKFSWPRHSDQRLAQMIIPINYWDFFGLWLSTGLWWLILESKEC
jgi:hypothetical protein